MYVLYQQAIIWVLPVFSMIEKKVEKKMSPPISPFLGGKRLDLFFLSFLDPLQTVVEVVSNLFRNVPYFYNTFWVIKFTLVSALILCLKQPWWSAALAHTITWCMTMPQPSKQVSSSHHGRCHLRLVWAQSIWGVTGTWSHHHHVFVQFHGEPAIAQFAMNMYLYSHWHRRNFCHPPMERPPS